ncbi:hypothetical protein [Salisediminibacterium beveridgei]|uniref:Uncharacterized protein n=1 Tax=Salisediminibacterium beveridgei TaxID=632773 RepID=A0A1D7QW13_9BACI|nr:hypothetical protein [Salisediminibacterium beveridgei]AOM83159.1 hypothetical protein BBEV_1798 [Salisediminibacterium beveridgei]
MSGLRAIDLQMAMPRAQMAGKIQDQLQQRGQTAQDMMAESGQQQDQRDASRVTTLDGVVQNRAENNGANALGKAESEMEKQRPEEQLTTSMVPHPFKGNLFDEIR